MKNNNILVIATIGFLAMFAACTGEQTTESSDTTVTSSTESPATTDVTTESTQTESTDTNVADQAASAGEQITEGAKMVGKGLKEEARQAVAAGGAAIEQAGQTLQDKAAAAAPTTAPAPAPSGDVASGASIFKGKCVSCHGADASGNTPIGKKNNIPDLRSSGVQNLTDTELATLIANGKPGGMSAGAHKSKALTAKQIEDVIAYLRSIRG